MLSTRIQRTTSRIHSEFARPAVSVFDCAPVVDVTVALARMHARHPSRATPGHPRRLFLSSRATPSSNTGLGRHAESERGSRRPAFRPLEEFDRHEYTPPEP